MGGLRLGDVATTIDTRSAQGAGRAQGTAVQQSGAAVLGGDNGGASTRRGTTILTPRKVVQPRGRLADGGANSTRQTGAANDTATPATTSATPPQAASQSKTGTWSGYGLVSAVTTFLAKLFSQGDDSGEGTATTTATARMTGQAAYAQANLYSAAPLSGSTSYTMQGGMWPVATTGGVIDLTA